MLPTRLLIPQQAAFDGRCPVLTELGLVGPQVRTCGELDRDRYKGIASARAETLADAMMQFRRLAVMAEETPRPRARLASPGVCGLAASVPAAVKSRPRG